MTSSSRSLVGTRMVGSAAGRALGGRKDAGGPVGRAGTGREEGWWAQVARPARGQMWPGTRTPLHARSCRATAGQLVCLTFQGLPTPGTTFALRSSDSRLGGPCAVGGRGPLLAGPREQLPLLHRGWPSCVWLSPQHLSASVSPASSSPPGHTPATVSHFLSGVDSPAPSSAPEQAIPGTRAKSRFQARCETPSVIFL